MNNIKSISVQECRDIIENKEEKFTLLDVRTTREHEIEHIVGDVLIPLSELQSRVNELNREEKILIYCETGNRSQVACMLLKAQGFNNCINILGGISAWVRAGYEVERTNNSNFFSGMFGI